MKLVKPFEKFARAVKELWLKITLLVTVGKTRPYVSNRMPINLQFFAEPPGGNEPPGGGDPNKEGGEPFATFKTEEEFKSKLTDAEKQGQLNLAKSLGFDSVEAMQESLKQKKQPEKKEGNEGGKKEEKTPDVDSIIDEKLKAEREKTFQRLMRSEVKMQAAELGFADWEDALALADLSQVKEDEHGNIIGVDAALKALSEKKPHLLKQQQKQSNGTFGASIPNQSGAQKKVVGYDAGKSIAEQRNQGGKK